MYIKEKTMQQENLLAEAQQYVAEILNENLSSCCEFFPENLKTIENSIKKSLGQQGVVGVVVTPKAQFLGRWEDQGNAWEMEIGVWVVENPAVNRNRPATQEWMSAQDLACLAAEYLCPARGEREGHLSPTTIDVGEQDGLLVAKLGLKCVGAKFVENPYPSASDSEP